MSDLGTPLESMVPAEPAPAALRRGWSFWGGLAFDLLLVALIAAGLVFRFSWANWNQGTDLHPDEYGLTATLTRLSIPDSLGDYFNTRLSSISPYQKYDASGAPTEPGPDNRMRWGQWPITLIRWAAEVTDNTGYSEMRLLGRRLSALADSLALLVIFLIGRRLYGYRAGLLAAALSALAVMQIQQSHFMTADNFAVLFVALSMYCAVRAASPSLPYSHTGWKDVGGWGWYVLFGIASGMALASRINLAPLFGMILVAAFIAYFDRLQREPLEPALLDAGLRVGLAGAALLLTFRVTQPMSFRAETGDTTLLTLRPNPEWVESMQVAQAESSGRGGGPPGEQWTNRPALAFPWINMVLWGMGLPLGLAAWAGFGWALWRAVKDDQAWKAHLLPLVWVGGYFLFMGTRWVKSIRYFLPLYPFLALLAAWALLEVWRGAAGGDGAQAADGGLRTTDDGRRTTAGRLWSVVRRPSAAALVALVSLGTLAWAWGFTGIYRADNTRIQASRWVYQNVPAPVGLHIFDGQEMTVESLPMPEGLPLSADSPHWIPFRPWTNGTLSGVTLGHARSANGATLPAVVRVVLAADPAGEQPLAQVDVPLDYSGPDPRGGTFYADFGPAALEAGVEYSLLLTAPEGGPVLLTGATLSNEHWDEGLPLRLDGRDAFGGLYQGLEMTMRWADNEDKRQMLLRNLAAVDFIILPSQRAIWSASRLPNTYPLTLEYYRALFDGRLGFDLAAEFQTPIRLGPLQVSDIAGTWAWDGPPDLTPNPDDPFNDNLLAAEEAFSVYDHAPVWIFRKRPDFSLDQVRAVLDAVDLSSVVNQGPREATTAPTLLMLPPDRLAEQRAGGTWSEMFDPGSLLNRFQPLGVLAWWLAVLVVGWLAFPLTYLVFGGFADRGYPLAKSVALLVVAWFVWFLSSYRVLAYTRPAIALGFAGLALVSGLIYWTRREAFHAYLRDHWRQVLFVEALFLGLFVFDLLIRLGNPDLWHPWKGGEKPMNFSYFNAVLKSTSFPPYDPWLSGGYINYYYYGYVIVGLLVKLLGVVPAFAYNLILPTLFGLLGTGAFCVAYNLVRGVGASGDTFSDAGTSLFASDPAAQANSHTPASVSIDIASPSEPDPHTPILPPPQPAGDPDAAVDSHTPTLPASLSNTPLKPTPSPLLAGLAATLLVVVLGNLAQVEFLVRNFQRAADHAALATSPLGDNEITATLNGLWRVSTGQADLPASLDAWYWDASRIVAYREGEENGNEITEFPLFTFLYADLHAHMMDFPFIVLAVAWSATFVLSARRERSRAESLALWLVGGLAFGVTRPTNTWDYPVCLALGAVAVTAGQWLRQPRLSRLGLWGIAWRLALLAGLATVFYRPYDHWFASGYTEVELWKGGRTPLDAYLYVHGLFLFILASFLAWETRRWLAETPASILAEAGEWLPYVIAGLLALGLALAGLLYLGVPTGVLSLLLMTWAGLLLLRRDMPPARRVVLFLTGTGLALTLFVEVFVLKGDIGRQNTIFKFYAQAWILFSVAAGAALAWVWAGLEAWRPRWQWVWTSALAVLVASAALYTVTASGAKIRDRFPSFGAAPDSGCQPLPGVPMPYANDRSLPPQDQPHTLDGLAYLQWSAYCDRTYFLPLEYDYEAVRWLQDNVAGSPVIAEAQSFDLYRMSSRYAWNTGLPDVVGWDWHQRQQRATLPTEFIQRRGFDVIEFYEAADLDSARWFVQKYDVRYVIVGPMERAYYPPEGLAKFDALVGQGELSVVYQNPGVTIYQVNQ